MGACSDQTGPNGEAQARGEIALLRSRWPKAEHAAAPGAQARLWLPDENDIHVLAVAVDASADLIMTLNAKDFPRGILAEEGLDRVDPDSYLMSLWPQQETALREVADAVLGTARALSGKEWELRPLMKKARLPRFAKALAN